MSRYSREALVGRIGEDLVAAVERQALAAPAPSPQKVEELRSLFAPARRCLEAKRAAVVARSELAA